MFRVLDEFRKEIAAELSQHSAAVAVAKRAANERGVGVYVFDDDRNCVCDKIEPEKIVVEESGDIDAGEDEPDVDLEDDDGGAP